MNAKGPSNDEYETPLWLFKALDTEFGFTFDAAANEKNHLCDRWTDDLLGRKPDPGSRVFCNPPYSKIDMFVDFALHRNELWVLLLPSRTGNDWFRKLTESPKVQIRFLRKRIQFLIDGKPPLGKDGKPQGPRFDSLIAIVKPR